MNKRRPGLRIRLMMRGLLKLAMVWLLVAPPALCRAGVLADCCEDQQTETSTAAVKHPCCRESTGGCKEEQSSPHRVPDPAPKSCGTCAAVCSSPAKPAEEPILPTPAAVLLTSLSVASELLPTQASHDSACSCNQRKLPFPSSDVPLLI